MLRNLIVQRSLPSKKKKKRILLILWKMIPLPLPQRSQHTINEDLNKDVHPISQVLKDIRWYQSQVARGKATISKINQKERLKFALDYVAEEITFSGHFLKTIIKSKGRHGKYFTSYCTTELQMCQYSVSTKIPVTLHFIIIPCYGNNSNAICRVL